MVCTRRAVHRHIGAGHDFVAGRIAASSAVRFHNQCQRSLCGHHRLTDLDCNERSGQDDDVGELCSSVYSDPDNVFCAGCLDFFYTVSSSSTSIDDIERITVASFGSFRTDVGYSTGTGSVSGGVVPSTVDRSSNGATIGFNFNEPTGVAPGQETMVLEIQTNATNFMIGDLQIIDSSVASVSD